MRCLPFRDLRFKLWWCGSSSALMKRRRHLDLSFFPVLVLIPSFTMDQGSLFFPENFGRSAWKIPWQKCIQKSTIHTILSCYYCGCCNTTLNPRLQHNHNNIMPTTISSSTTTAAMMPTTNKRIKTSNGNSSETDATQKRLLVPTFTDKNNMEELDLHSMTEDEIKLLQQRGT